MIRTLTMIEASEGTPARYSRKDKKSNFSFWKVTVLWLLCLQVFKPEAIF
jgi:hypothetical protein